jgi:6-phosphogluconolactonase
MAAPPRALRHRDRSEVVTDVAIQLLNRLAELQRGGRAPQLALSGDPLAYRVLAALVARAPGSALNAARLGLWWTDDAFLPTHSRERHSLRALSLLAGTLQLDPARIHPVPSSDAYPDPEAAAHAYAQDLAQSSLDICLLELGPLGQVAGLFPGQRGAGSEPVVGVTDAPDGPAERVSLGLPAINAAREVWVLAAGAQVAGLVAASFAGAQNLPSARVRGRERTWWYLDDPAAHLLPFHTCEL